MAEQNRQWQTRQDGLDKVFQSSGPLPTPSDGEVLVRIKSVSLNYRDTEGTSFDTSWHTHVLSRRAMLVDNGDLSSCHGPL